MTKLSTCITLPNDYEVSIQHSDQHYCGPNTVEVAVIHKGEFIDNFPHWTSSGVASHVTAPRLIEIINWAMEQRG